MKEENFITAFLVVVSFAVVGLVAFIPVSMWKSAGISQKAINQECGTDYSQWDLLFAGDNLTELCRIKQQELLIKQ